MPGDYDRGAYPEPPARTPVMDKQASLLNPVTIVSELFHYTVDLPVTKFKAIVDSFQRKDRLVYYHQRFRRVPDLTECLEGDHPCYYEAEMQWRRDFRVDQEIVKMIEERMKTCYVREGHSNKQNCAQEVKLFTEVTKNYQSRYGDLGVHATAKKCLMKQKERMMAAQAAQAQSA